MDDNKSFWDWFAKLYGPFMERGSKRLYEDICRKVRPQLNRQMNVLELACGSGQFSFRLSPCVRLWEATDFSGNMIAEARKLTGSSRLHFSVQDATALPYAKETFDTVFIANALHIMPYPEKALSEIRRVLKQDGVLFAPTFICGKGMGFQLRAKMLELAGFRVFFRWDMEGIEQFVAENGFSVSRAERMGSDMAPLCYLEAKPNQRCECMIGEDKGDDQQETD